MISGAVKGFTNIAKFVAADGIRELNAKVLTKPALLVTDGDGVTYAVDVDIGEGKILKNVPLSAANADLIYCDAGNPCRLRRTSDGSWTVVGFSKEAPGTYTRFAVSLADFSFGPVEDLGVSARPLTYEELSSLGTYGALPYGAVGIFRGSTLVELR